LRFEKSKFFTQLLDRLLLLPYGLSQAQTFNLKTLCKSIISSGSAMCDLSHSQQKTPRLYEALRLVISKKIGLNFKQLFDR